MDRWLGLGLDPILSPLIHRRHSDAPPLHRRAAVMPFGPQRGKDSLEEESVRGMMPPPLVLPSRCRYRAPRAMEAAMPMGGGVPRRAISTS
ncbi:hypothetical protein E2562_002762 [Oryza meyeriana var. granulata]|uniref:Uncharacterized protein n=1 Tax=Oryza meyeriana var. granulata TaxID=110450 RepID=A0A6G1BSF7_9ORYZ|nr:hypothetical protein E2562_002762 [Oryza meyeriana var. granulata]